MSNSQKIDQKDLKESEAEILPPTPEGRVNSVLESLELLAIEKSKNSRFDTSSFNEKQIDKLLEILSKNEDNAFKFHKNRVDAKKELELAKINSNEVNRKTFRYIVIAVFPILTAVILIYKDGYFTPWLTFFTGILGGFGLNNILNATNKEVNKDPS